MNNSGSMNEPNFETITHNESTFAKILPGRSFATDTLAGVDAVIIEYTDRQSVLNLIREIRSHDDKTVYLKPIFLHKFYRESDVNVARFADGTITNLSDLSAIADAAAEINERA